MHYTYVLENSSRPRKKYIGHTSNLRRRLKQHNAGENKSTAKSAPWKLKLYIAFETRTQARQFEHYLKSGSGHAFANRHFWSKRTDRSAGFSFKDLAEDRFDLLRFPVGQLGELILAASYRNLPAILAHKHKEVLRKMVWHVNDLHDAVLRFVIGPTVVHAR